MVNAGLWDLGHKTWGMQNVEGNDSHIRNEKID
jgi:hypothetical protein